MMCLLLEAQHPQLGKGGLVGLPCPEILVQGVLSAAQTFRISKAPRVISTIINSEVGDLL